MENDIKPAIVSIGASAGGVKALQAFFAELPQDSGAAFVVIMHLDPDMRSEMATILRAKTSMPVVQVENQMVLAPNHVYVIAPNRQLLLSEDSISALPFEEPHGHRAPIDMFFRSLAQQRADAFAIVLTGAGEDGSVGVRAIKEAGGIVLVQDPIEAEFTSMPRSAIATDVADFVLPIKDLVTRLVELLDGRETLPSLLKDQQEEQLRQILTHVRSRTGHDFTHYKRPTVLRRIARRAQVSRKENLAEYYKYMRDNAEEAQALFGDFLISVTTFFRDPATFEMMERDIIPRLFEGKDAADAVRVWVPGCATGEEAYSIAMLLLEEATRRELRSEIQVFGTDLDMNALTSAREGLYARSIENDVSEDRLKRFFRREGDHYRVRRELRDIVLFANHSLLKDPPFSRLDLVSCRNLLIYLDRDLQSQVCSTFHYALNSGAYLLLGSSENADQPSGLFKPVDRDARIFRALAHPPERRPALLTLMSGSFAPEKFAPTTKLNSGIASVSDAAVHRQMLEKIAPPSILVDEAHRAIHLSEHVGIYLQPSGGPATTDIVDLVREEFRFDLRTALNRAFDRGEPSLSIPIIVSLNGGRRRVYLQTKPIVEDGDVAGSRFALVFFVEGETLEDGQADGGDAVVGARPATDTIRRLQEELQLTQNRLRTMREESEAGNEELRAANEELQSINEEYRSTSEELETSKEELQSINEELQTVNNELKLKLEGISQAHSDLQNLMAATDFGTLFLDTQLRIKRFTPRLTDLFNVTASDEGRPITDFTHELNFDDMADQARAVLKDLTPIEREIPGRKQGWYLVRMRPYRTIDDRIDGIVATFVDISERRRIEDALRNSEQQLRHQVSLVELSRSPIFVWDLDDGIIDWNRGSEELYGYSRAEALGIKKDKLLLRMQGPIVDISRQELESQGTWSGEIGHVAKDGRVLVVESQIEMATLDGKRLAIESTRDITDRRAGEMRQRMLLSELTHRVKNTLTVVQSISNQTLRHSKTSAEFAEQFEGRLSALAHSHELLVASEWQGAELGALARLQLEAYGMKDRQRISIDGPEVVLPPETATPFGLVLHELATNATKYGALSVDDGTVTVSWTLSSDSDYPALTFRWQELGGPPADTPRQPGFGSSLIKRGLAGATVDHEFFHQGVVCTIGLKIDRTIDDVLEKSLDANK